MSLSRSSYGNPTAPFRLHDETAYTLSSLLGCREIPGGLFSLVDDMLAVYDDEQHATQVQPWLPWPLGRLGLSRRHPEALVETR